MKYRSEQLRDALAAEYALGTLKGAARRRFERLLKEDPALRYRVETWQTRLEPLGDRVAPVSPPGRIWKAVESRIQGRARPTGIWQSLPFWRGLAGLCATAILVLVLALGVERSNRLEGQEHMIVVMSDDKSRPMMTVSWPMENRHGKLRIRVIGHQEMAPETAWELWMLPSGDGKPRSLGLITTHETQEVDIPDHLMPAVNAAWGMAMSVEPKGGSPTGTPSGPVLYSGQCTKI